MGKSTVKVKHLGLISTGKFAAIFAFIFSTLMLLVMGVIFGVMMLLTTVLGLAFGGANALLGTLITGGFSIVTFLIMAVVMVVLYTIFGFIAGVIGAFAFNMVVKLSGGLSFDAEIT